MRIVEKIELNADIAVAVRKFLDREDDPAMMYKTIANSISIGIKNCNKLSITDKRFIEKEIGYILKG